jgi:hypothetical protein
LFAFPKVEAARGKSLLKLSQLDGELCRSAFFAIPHGDNEGLLRFLTSVGVWSNQEIQSHWCEEIMQHCNEGHPTPVDVAGLWRFRDSLKQTLLDRGKFKKDYASPLPAPETDLQLALQSGIEFPLRFELTGVASGVVSVAEAHQMLLATVFIDIARGTRFKQCARQDCGAPFPVTSERNKQFCKQYCGHLVSQRKVRAKKRAARNTGSRQDA